MSTPQLSPGQVVAGRYTIRTKLHDDGAVASYQASAAQNSEVVVRMLSTKAAQLPQVMSGLQQVHAQLATLPPALVSHVADAGIDPGTAAPYTVTARIGAPSLAEAVASLKLAPKACAKVLEGLARALDAAHAIQLFHHNLKPTNVFLPDEGVKVIDFGLNLVRATIPTYEGFAHAAPWMAPEQIQGGGAGATADVFSTALIAFFAMTGSSYWRSAGGKGVPFDANAFQQELAMPREKVSARAQALRVNLPPSLDVVFARALAPNPADRYSSVEAFAKAFGEGFTSAGISMSSMPPPANPGAPAAGAPAQGRRGRSAPKATEFAVIPPGGVAALVPPPAPTGFSAEDTVAVAGSPSQPPPAGFAQPQQQQQVAPAQHAAPAPPYAPSQPPPALTPAPAPVASLPPEPKKSSKLPLILVLLLLFLGGGGAAVYFLVLNKPEETKKEKKTEADGDEEKASKKKKKGGDGEDDEKGKKPAPSASASTEPDPAPSASAAASASGSNAPVPADAVDVTIKCDPACDFVSIDAKKLDDPTAVAKLAPGTHALYASKGGYKPIAESIVVKAGEPLIKSYTLVAAPAGTAPAASASGSAKKPCGKFLKKCD